MQLLLFTCVVDVCAECCLCSCVAAVASLPILSMENN